MAQDPRPFIDRNLGNPTNKIKEMPAVRVSSNSGTKNFTIPRDVGAANRPKRK